MPKKPHEEHDNAERYLVTYADLITLLLGLFVILYASAQTDTPKYIAVSRAMRNFFSGSGRVIDNGGARGGSLSKLPDPSKAGGELSLIRLQAQILEALEDPPSEKVEGFGLDSSGADDIGGSPSIEMEMQERGLVIHLSESMFFESGRAALKPQGLHTLDKVAPALRKISNSIRVEGYTDNTPIHTVQFPSNWHLSAVRAINTATYLLERHHIPGARISVAGYGEYRPIAPNDTPRQRMINRRVDLVILSDKESGLEPRAHPRTEDAQLPEHRSTEDAHTEGTPGLIDAAR